MALIYIKIYQKNGPIQKKVLFTTKFAKIGSIYMEICKNEEQFAWRFTICIANLQKHTQIVGWHRVVFLCRDDKVLSWSSVVRLALFINPQRILRGGSSSLLTGLCFMWWEWNHVRWRDGTSLTWLRSRRSPTFQITRYLLAKAQNLIKQ